MNTENNKIIAEFLEANPFREFINKNIYSYEMYGIIESIDDSKDEKQFYLPEEMLFNSDWNWLMEVVEKIENTKTNTIVFDVFITKNKTHIHYSKNNEWFSNIFLYEGKTKIENTYDACVEFIKWYNQQK